ncbi:MAG: cytochrome c biogenesis heme-transporting ATPase CcmA [Gammaproteobacteria bacterium]
MFRLQASHFAGISGREIHVWRGDRHVLRGVAFEAAAGDVLHVAGPNGVGKTTLLRVCAGLLRPEQGSVQWSGRPIAADRDAYFASIGYLGHSDGLKPDFSARENLAFEAGLRRVLDAGEINAMLARVGLGEARDVAARSLSAGQRRRLALARVMLAGAALWILDEPFTNLDAAGVQFVSEAITAQCASGGAVLFAAHQAPSFPRRTVRRLELS